MENTLKTTITIEFAASEVQTAAEILAHVAAARKIAGYTERCPSAPAAQADDAEPAPERPTRGRKPRAAKAVESTVEPEIEPQPVDDPGDLPSDDTEPTPAENKSGVTHDDIREVMVGVIDADDSNRERVLAKLKAVGAKSVGTIPDDELGGFYEFLVGLKNA